MTAPARFGEFGSLAGHLRFVERRARGDWRGRASHGMVVFRAGMERRQAFLFRSVDIAMELFAMAATVAHAARLADGRYPEAERARELADLFCGGRGGRCAVSSATCGTTTTRARVGSRRR